MPGERLLIYWEMSSKKNLAVLSFFWPTVLVVLLRECAVVVVEKISEGMRNLYQFFGKVLARVMQYFLNQR